MHNKFEIEALDEGLATALMDKINLKTKPLGSLGLLEALACQLGQIQQTLCPQLCQPKMIVFAADHGIALEGISAFPQEVTAQMVQNYLAGGAAVNVFCRQHAIELEIVDLGVKQLPEAQGLVSCKIAESTQSFLQADAMSAAQCQQAMSIGAERVSLAAKQGSNVVAFGEMGIANTASAAALMAGCLNIDVAECVGRGTGLDDAGLQHKTTLLQQAMAYHQGAHTPEQWLAKVGGFELAAMVGAMLQAAQQRMVILVDGFICSAAALVASQMAPLVTQYMVFCHQSAEQAHQRLLQALAAKPLLGLSLRLGEGSGAALAYPLVESAALFLNEMASFASAGVSREHD